MAMELYGSEARPVSQDSEQIPTLLWKNFQFKLHTNTADIFYSGILGEFIP